MSSYEYNQLLKFLYFEGYAESYAEAEQILEEMTDEEFEQLLEAKDIPQEVALKIANALKGAPKFSRRGRIAGQLRQFAVDRNKKRVAKLQQNVQQNEEADNSYLETDMKKRRKNNEKAIENMKNTDAYKSMVGTIRKKFEEEYDIFESVVEYLFVEGFADTIESAELMAESISAEWVNDIMEKLAHKFPLSAKQKELARKIGERARGSEEPKAPRSARKVETPAQPPRRRTTDLSKVIVAHYLYNEGYADTMENAEEMAENISEEWVNDIIEKFDPKDYKEYHQKNHRDERNPSSDWDAQERDWQDSRGDIRDKHTQARGVKKKRGSKDVNEKYVKAMDTTGRGADRRAHTTDPSVRPTRRKPTPEKYKHSEAEFDSTLRSPSARKRKEERRQAVGGFREEYEEIDEAAKDQSDKQIDKGVKTTYKAGNVLDNLHQGRSRGIEKMDARDRDAKVERMRGRLKTRRDDLFKERGNREDEKREKLKKLLGL